MPTTLSYARFGLEDEYKMANPSTTNWHYIDPLTAGLSTEANNLERSQRWGNRAQRHPGLGFPATGGILGTDWGPHNLTTLLYAALGTLNTNADNAASGYYSHAFTTGTTQRSIYYMEYLDEQSTWLLYPGTTVQRITITGDMDAILRCDFDLHSATTGARDDLSITPSWSWLLPFTGVKGSITKDSETWTDTDNFVIDIDLGTLHGRTWGSRAWRKAGTGGVRITTRMNCYFDSQTLLLEFLGDVNHDLSEILLMDDTIDVIDNLTFIAQTDEDANSTVADPPTTPYQTEIIIPRLTWSAYGPCQEEEDFIRQPMVGVAHYDPHDLYDLQITVRNQQTEAQVTDALSET